MLVIAATWFELAPVLARLSAEQAPGGPEHTTRESRSPLGWVELRTGHVADVPVAITAGGIGKANTAAAIARVSARVEVGAVLQLGIGGAYPAGAGGPALPLGSVAVAASEFDLDLGVGEGDAWRGLEALGFAAVATDPPTYNRIACDTGSSHAVARALACPHVPFATSDRVTADRATARRIADQVGAAIESMEGAAAAQVCLALGLPFVEVRAVSNEVGVRDKSEWRVREAIAAVGDAALAALPVIETD